MAFNAGSFRANMEGDGARPNLFDVQIRFPDIAGTIGGMAQDVTRFFVKGSQLPGSTIGSIPIHYFGREVKFAGNRTFADWTITVINDEGALIRSAFESWMDGINSHSRNRRDFGGVNPADYVADGKITQYGKAGDTIGVYNMIDMFPVDVSPIEMDWGTNDTIEEFSVTFAYQYWNSEAYGTPVTS